MNLTINTTRILQILGGIIHVGNIALGIAGFIPPKVVPVISGIVACAQVWVNEIAHNSTPDGNAISLPSSCVDSHVIPPGATQCACGRATVSPVPATGAAGSSTASPVGKS